MARVKVHAQCRTDLFADAQHGLCVIHTEPRVQLKADLVHTVVGGEFHEFRPIGEQHIVPLIVQNIAEFIRPRAGDPVRVFRCRAVARTAGEGVDLMDTELFRKQNRLTHFIVELLCNVLVRMHGVAVAADGADFNVVFFDKILEFLQFGFAVQQHLGIRVLFAGIAARTDLHHFDAERGEVFQGFFQRPAADHVCQYAEFHRNTPLHDRFQIINALFDALH